MSLPVVFNVDDFSPQHMSNEIWDLFLRLKRIYPKLKVNMFTIPMLCSEGWIRWVANEFPWIEMHYHGSWHKDKKEWLGRKSIYLPYLDKNYFRKCFKAPWWEIDQTTVDTLNEMGIVVAHKRVKNPNLRGNLYLYDDGVEIVKSYRYEKDGYQTWQAHVTPQEGPTPNGIEDIWESLTTALPMDAEFLFISEVVEC